MTLEVQIFYYFGSCGDRSVAAMCFCGRSAITCNREVFAVSVGDMEHVPSHSRTAVADTFRHPWSLVCKNE